MDIICDGNEGSWVGLLHDLLEFIKLSSGNNCHPVSYTHLTLPTSDLV